LALEHGWELAWQSDYADFFTRGEEQLNCGYRADGGLANVDHRRDSSQELRETSCSGPLDRAIIAEMIIKARHEIVEWAVESRLKPTDKFRLNTWRNQDKARTDAEMARDLGYEAYVVRRTASPWERVK
jgi:hypothetical protein